MLSGMRWPLVALALFLAGCGGYVGRAQRAYHDGRYLEAAERLGEHEHEMHELSPRRQAEYGLYRGLSLLELGDTPGAHRWLAFAYEVERVHPGSLKPEQRAELGRGWTKLAHMLAPLPPNAIVLPPGAAPAAVQPAESAASD